MNKLLYSALLAALAVSASAQTTPDKLYLIKCDRVVGKYNVDDVDYATFSLPADVNDDALWLSVDNAGKNTVTYTVNTQNEMTAYAHNVISWYEVNYNAMDMLQSTFDELDAESKDYILRYSLSINGYLGVGSRSYTQTDFQLDGSNSYSRFSVLPGTKYFLVAWEVDPANDYAPLDFFAAEEFTTQPAGESAVSFDVTFKRFNEHGVALNFSGSPEISYVQTVWGYKSMLDQFVTTYGKDYVMNTFGERYDMATLQGTGELMEGIENATWPAYESDTYVMMARAYDVNGDCKDVTLEIVFEADKGDGPEIKILDKSKSPGNVSVTFEVTPSNVIDATVIMLEENTVDDRLNDGYELYEIASGGSAIDVTNAINTTGEYTFTATDVPETWQCILIYARDSDGARTTLRLNFNTDPDSRWSIYDPVHAPKLRKLPSRILSKHNPTLPKSLLK